MKIKLYKEEKEMNTMEIFTGKRIVILVIVAIVAIVLGRMAVRGFLNLLLGGTMFGGNFL